MPLFCRADFRHEFAALNDRNVEIVDEMGIVADEEDEMGIVADQETTVDVDDGGRVMIKSQEMTGSLVTIVQLDNGLTQV